MICSRVSIAVLLLRVIIYILMMGEAGMALHSVVITSASPVVQRGRLQNTPSETKVHYGFISEDVAVSMMIALASAACPVGSQWEPAAVGAQTTCEPPSLQRT
jgi:hypothetical protein